MTLLTLSALFSLAAPLVLLAVEMFLPWPHILEEIAKAALVMMVIKGERELKTSAWEWAVGVGVFFTFSETSLYLVNFLSLGTTQDLLKRIFLTGLLHIGTPVMMYFGLKQNWYWGAGTIMAAMVFHFGFNVWLGLR